MFSKKSIGPILGCAFALGMSATAFAAPISVGGITWQSGAMNIGSSILDESSITGPNQTLVGYGLVTSINSQTSFCVVAGCNLTFSFSYNVSSIDGDQIVFNGGTINFFVSSPGTFVPSDPSSAALGTAWLTLTGVPATFAFPNSSETGTGTLLSTIVGTVGVPQAGSSGLGYLDATDGPAARFFGTKSISYGPGQFANFLLTTQFQTDAACLTTPPGTGCNPAYPITGGATIQGFSSVPVPEPNELGMIGLGAGLLGLLLWRRRREATDRT